MLLVVLTSLPVLCLALGLGQEPNPPTWPDSVSIFSPESSTEEIESVVNAAYAINGGNPVDTCGNGEFSIERFAFMFLPGTYESIDVPIGYYTSVYGLGLSPTDTVFNGAKGPYAEEACGQFTIGALGTFWRSAENFHTKTDYPWAVGSGMSWVVSQAAPLRNVKVDSDLLLFEYLDEYCCAAGYASGGWASGVEVGGKVAFGSQQQYMVRSSSSEVGFETPVWNGVFAGVNGAPLAQCGLGGEESPQASISVVDGVPLVAEKPYMTSLDNGATFQLIVPTVQSDPGPGVAWSSAGFKQYTTIEFSDVYVATAADTSATMNDRLKAGLHLVVTPGIYTLDTALYVQFENQVILGLGIATLTAPLNGEPCILIGDVPGVRVAGLLLQAAASVSTAAMLQVGGGTYQGVPSNPTVLSDVFVRVGGPEVSDMGPVGAMFLIQSGYTIIDNTWLWRADHGSDGQSVYNGNNPAKNGLVVRADNVYAYGLAVEHTTEDNVVWEGDSGVTIFFQAEIMYDALEPVWNHSCYRLGDGVNAHTGTGMGCYSFFRDAAVVVPIGIDTGLAKNVEIDKATSVYLNGQTGSGIANLYNNDGKFVNETVHVQYHCQE